jgi:hypothetical protein
MRYYMHEGPTAFRFELDLSFVTGLDEAVRSLFRRWYAGGSEFAAGSKWSRESALVLV